MTNVKNKIIRMEKKMLGAALVLLCVLSSCASRKNITYLADMKMGEKYPIGMKYEASVHRDDRLEIKVSCKNQELAIPFNIPGGNFRVSAGGEIEPSDGSGGKGYRVDKDGDIDFPILGKLHVEGLKVSEVKELIESRIKKGNYIKDPLVSIEFLNFKYTVIGAVGHNGTFRVDGDRVTLLEAIANAGDLAPKGKIDKVAVIREVNNERQIFMHDLRSKDIFDSPCFYLQQNDIVYVEPKYRKKDNEERGWQFTTVLLSLVSVITSILWVTK